eukprot:GFUD01008964.1.p1 GENE.GFUD01008964.1~~GFUD01008964.1.p1  ORF type:complete len:627 (+),score=139.19 GFUD01008964.1:53-1933(+)
MKGFLNEYNMTKKQNKENGQVNLVSAMLALLQKNVPVLSFWEHKGELKHLGPSFMADWFNNLDDVLKENLKASMAMDMINISNDSESLSINPNNVPEKVRASAIYKTLVNDNTHPSGTPYLPYPLSLMSKKEKAKYLCSIITSEAKDQKKKMIYGAENFRPSFWLENLWSWSNLKQSLTKVEEKMFTGQGSWTEFLSETIRVMLESRSLGTETHVENLEQKMNTIKKKKRFFGIHDPPIIITGKRAPVDCSDNHDTQEGIENKVMPEDSTVEQLGLGNSFSSPHADIDASIQQQSFNYSNPEELGKSELGIPKQFMDTEKENATLFPKTPEVENHKRCYEREHKCTTCPKSYSCPRRLKNHIQCCSGARTLPCPVTDQNIVDEVVKLAQETSVLNSCKVHKMEVSTVKNWMRQYSAQEHQCKVCEKIFVTKTHLVSHMRTHDEVYENGNKIEGSKMDQERNKIKESKPFASKSQLKRHAQYHNPEDSRHLCYICSKTFASKDTLNNHFRCVHPEMGANRPDLRQMYLQKHNLDVDFSGDNSLGSDELTKRDDKLNKSDVAEGESSFILKSEISDTDSVDDWEEVNTNSSPKTEVEEVNDSNLSILEPKVELLEFDDIEENQVQLHY